MIRKTLRFTRHTFFFVIHLLAGFFLLGIALLVLLVWKFSQGPIDLTFAADYVRDAFQDKDQGITVTFGRIVAEWPKLEGSPDINLSNFTILENGQEKIHIGEVGLQFAILPLLIGKIQPETIRLNNPIIRVIHDTDGSFRLLVADTEETLPVDPAPPTAGARIPVEEIGNSLFLGGKVLDPSLRIFADLRAVNILAAKLIIDDRNSHTIWALPKISMYMTRSKDSVDFSASYLPPDRPELASMSAHIGRLKKDKGFSYSADIRNADVLRLARTFSDLAVLKGQSMVMNGIIEGRFDPQWRLDSVIAAVRSPAGTIRLNEAQEEKFAYKNLAVNLAYDKAANKFSISNTNLDINGTTLSITADREMSADGKAVLPIRVSVPQITLDQIAALWPEQYKDTNAADWLTRRLSKATLRNIAITVRVPEDDPASLSGKDIDGMFDFENLTTDYRAPLTPATQSQGRATLKDDTLDIEIDSGKVGDLTVRSGRVTITNLTADINNVGTVTILADIGGPVASVFEYISKEPINLGKAIGVDPKAVAGQGDYKVDVSFPALKDLLASQVVVKVDATLNNIRLPKIVHGMDLSGGPFALKVAGGSFTISGQGLLDTAPIDLTYSEYIDPANAPYASDIIAKVTTDEKIRQNFGINIGQFITGTMPLEIHYKEVKPGDVAIDAKADLTPAKAIIEPINFIKNEGSPGELTCVVILKDKQVQTIKDLVVTMGKDKATGGQLLFGKVGPDWDVKSGSFSSVALGTDNNFSLKFTQSAPNVLSFDIKGSKFDGRAFLNPDKTPDDPAKPSPAVTLRAAVQTMRTGDAPDQVIDSPVLNADVNAQGDIRSLDLSATIGGGPFHLYLKPDASGVMNLTMAAANAGKTLRAFDIYDNMVGGTLSVDGKQIPGGQLNDMKGIASIKDFSVVKAPALAQLINGLSLSGVNELLTNKGISFTRLRTNYVWKRTADGRLINFTNGRTAGASIGLTFGGTVNQTKGTMDISGTFVPMSEINKVVSSIPIIGTLLTGGKNGGIIAATYAMKGPSDNPRVFVNPLSVLTPGFLRSILFENGLDMEEDDDEPVKAAPKPKRQFN